MNKVINKVETYLNKDNSSVKVIVTSNDDMAYILEKLKNYDIYSNEYFLYREKNSKFFTECKQIFQARPFFEEQYSLFVDGMHNKLKVEDLDVLLDCKDKLYMDCVIILGNYKDFYYLVNKYKGNKGIVFMNFNFLVDIEKKLLFTKMLSNYDKESFEYYNEKLIKDQDTCLRLIIDYYNSGDRLEINDVKDKYKPNLMDIMIIVKAITKGNLGDKNNTDRFKISKAALSRQIDYFLNEYSYNYIYTVLRNNLYLLYKIKFLENLGKLNLKMNFSEVKAKLKEYELDINKKTYFVFSELVKDITLKELSSLCLFFADKYMADEQVLSTIYYLSTRKVV